MNLVQQKAGKLLSENASSILTAAGVVGTVLTAVTTAKATFVAAESIALEKEDRKKQLVLDGLERQELDMENPSKFKPRDLTKKEMVLIVWPMYVTPTLIGSATIGSIVAANMMSARRAAALAAAYGLSQNQLEEYKKKVLEKVGVNKERTIRDEIAQDRVTNNPPSGQVLIIASGDVLCYDLYTGRYFQSSVDKIKKAETKLNQEMFAHEYVSLTQFYEWIGLERTTVTEELGWNQQTEGIVEINFSTTKSPDDRPCIAIDFTVSPRPNYNNTYN